jgi:hypothetical protein
MYLKTCTQLIAVFVKGNRIITRDLPYIIFLTNLRKVDISDNQICFLPTRETFAKLNTIEYLLLHNNKICGWRQVSYLMELTRLRLLTIQNNPCSKIKGTRNYIIQGIPTLYSLDERVISDSEREIYRELDLSTRHLKLPRFKQANHPFISRPPCTDIHADLKREHYALQRAFEHTSPFLAIQKTVKMWIKKRRYHRIRRQMKILFWALNRYYRRIWLQLGKCRVSSEQPTQRKN